MDKIWEQALPYPCQSCGARPKEWCTTRDGRRVTAGNGPHSERLARARGNYDWLRMRQKYGTRLLPGPSPDGPIGA